MRGDALTRPGMNIPAKGWLMALLIAAALWLLIAAAASATGLVNLNGDARVMVHFDTPRNVESLCGVISGGRLRNVAACGTTEVIVAPDPCGYPGRYAEILCHELRCHVTTGRADHGACRA